MVAATRRIARLKRIDRAAVFIITLGGLSVVASVLGILVFIASEAVPLFRSADFSAGASVPTAERVPAVPAMRALGVDEYRKYSFTITPDGRVIFYDISDGRQAVVFPVPDLPAGTAIVSSSRSLLGNFMAAGTSDGRVALTQVTYAPKYTDSVLSSLDVSVRARGVTDMDPARRPIRQVTYIEEEGRRYVAALVADDELALWRSDDAGVGKLATVRVPAGQAVTHVRAGRHGAFAAATTAGRMFFWMYDVSDDEPRLTDQVVVASDAVTALEFLIGGNSLIVGTENGSVTSWFKATLPDGREPLIKGHDYESQRSAVVSLAPSPRDRSFAAAGSDGSLVVRHQTSERTLARLPDAGAGVRLVMAPKADAVYSLAETALAVYTLNNPHPEVSLRTLFGKAWYEGYAAPEYVWQSTGGSDDFEPKLSLVPLIFGTIKGTLYAMLFAVPIAIFAALYTSQFVHPSIKAKIKPTVEIMAALPSVVIGFLAGLYLAAVVERNLVSVFLMMGLSPIFGTAGVVLWNLLPRSVAQRLRPGMEVFVIVPMLIVGGWVALAIGPSVELWLFAGDARSWIQSVMGLTYDQRNCLVVGLAMGFAVIPIIFTIAEDAFTSVPSNLTAASLALGASRWQTAVRVVLPTASPGVFSAVMIGFGRAVGETMIVLMATGNTPVMEWSIFNGIRTLSANIAVEIPEAPYGGTLYRTLFLAAALLFVMTFVINTVAEVIRQRLRDRYKAI